MTEFVGRVSSEETFLLGRIHGAFPSVEGCPEVRRAVVATTTVELLSDSSNRRLKIVGMLSCHDPVPGVSNLKGPNADRLLTQSEQGTSLERNVRRLCSATTA